VAVLSDLLAQRLPVEYPEGAFVAGLLHDVGRLLIALACPEEYDRLLDLYGRGGRTLIACEQEILGFTHPELSASAMEFWKLPEQIRVAVRDHHTPPRELALSGIVDAANQYVNSLGGSILVKNTDAADAGAIASMGLTPEKLAALLNEFRAENDEMAAYFR
jgi:HD-like signal output (HDOD) protein